MSRTLEERIVEKVQRVKKNLPYCKDNETIHRLAKAEAEGDIWKEVSEDIEFTQHSMMNNLSKIFKDFKSDVYIKFRNEGELKAKDYMKRWLDNKEWANGIF